MKLPEVLNPGFKMPVKLCSCGCGRPLEPRIDGERQKIDGKEVNADCYFKSLGEVVENCPPR